MPYECARAVCLTFCASIAGALIPLFGPNFPAECVPRDSKLFGKMSIDPSIVKHSTVEALNFRTYYFKKHEPRTPSPVFSKPDFSPSNPEFSSPQVSPRSERISSPHTPQDARIRPHRRRLRSRQPHPNLSSQNTSRNPSSSPEHKQDAQSPPTPVTPQRFTQAHHTTLAGSPNSPPSFTAANSTSPCDIGDSPRGRAPFRHLPAPAHLAGYGGIRSGGYTSTPANLKSYTPPSSSSSSPHQIANPWLSVIPRSMVYENMPELHNTPTLDNSWSAHSTSDMTQGIIPSIRQPSPTLKRRRVPNPTYAQAPSSTLINNRSTTSPDAYDVLSSSPQPASFPPRITQKIYAEDRQAALLLMKLSVGEDVVSNTAPSTPLQQFADVVLAQSEVGAGKRKRACSW